MRAALPAAPAQQRLAARPRQQHARGSSSVAAAAAKKPAAPAAKSKGFGPAKPPQKVAPGTTGCPCGNSNKTFKECCKPVLTGAVVGDVSATIRARFSAILKKDVSFLLRSTSPFFDAFHYGGQDPAAARRQLEDDLWSTVEHYEYSGLKIREVGPVVQQDNKLDECTAVFSYTVYDKRTPLLDDEGKKVRKVQLESSRFVRDTPDSLWCLADYKLVEVPEALARTAELQAKDMAASQRSDDGGGAQ